MRPLVDEPWDMEELAAYLTKAAACLRTLAEEVRETRATKTSSALARAKKAEAKVADLERRLAYENGRAHDMGRMQGRMRVALNGAGCNPLDEHAAKVLAALKKAAPDHPLVQPRKD